jgi:Ca-activated chloride channel family protein
MRTLLAAALCAALGFDGVAAQDPPKFRSSASAVMVDVSVRTRHLQPITGLRADDFALFDNGVRQTIDQVSYGKLPIDVTVALDVSGSVTGVLLDQLRQGVVSLTRGLGREDRLRLILFNSRIARMVDFTRDAAQVDAAIRTVPAGGGTALLDALSVALTSASDLERRQLLVVFTDGSDSVSTTAPDTLIEIAKRSRATVTLVMPASPGTVSMTGSTGRQTPNLAQVRRGPLHAVLATLAAESGGSILPVDHSSGLSSAFRTVLDGFRSAYVLYYRPTGVEPGGYHTIDVKVEHDATVQARRGYFGS